MVLVFLLCIVGLIYFLFYHDANDSSYDRDMEPIKIMPPAPHRTPRELTEELGRSTWLLLHILAENFPARPSTVEKRRFLSLLHSLEALYPHEESKETWKLVVSISSLPELNVALESRENLKAWLCGFHNDVNTWLSKSPRSCETKALAEAYSFVTSTSEAVLSAGVETIEDIGRSVFHDIIESATGPCDLPAPHSMLILQPDPVAHGFSFPQRRFGPAPVTVLVFSTSDCMICFSQLIRLSALRQVYGHLFNVIGIFEWNPSVPHRDDRVLIQRCR